MTQPPDSKPRRARMRGVWPWGLGFALMLIIAGAGVFDWAKGRELAIPGWLRAGIETRVAENAFGAAFQFGDMFMVLDEGWRPRVLLRDFRMSGADGQEMLAVSEVRASLAMRPLLRQEFELKSLDVQGVFLTLRRGANGAVTLSSAGAAPLGESSGVAQLVADLTDALTRPGLRALQRASLRALTLRYEDVPSDRAWTADGGRIRLTRQGDAVQLSADLAVLGGGAGAATIAANYTGRIGALGSEFGVNIADVEAADIATQGPAFAWLDPLRAGISGALRGGVDETGALTPLNVTLQISAGAIQPNPQAKPIPIDGARTYFSYVPSEGLLRFDELSVQSPWISGRLEGQTFLVGGSAGQPLEMVGQFDLADLEANPRDLFATPARIDRAQMDVRLRLDPFELTIGQFTITDQGTTLAVRGDLGARSDGWAVRLDGGIDRLSHQRLLSFWPQGAAQKARGWLMQNLSHADLENIEFAWHAEPGQRPKPYLAFDFRNAQAKFLPKIPSLRQGQGHASLLRDRFVLTVDRGFVQAPKGGWVSLAGSSYILPDLTVKDPPFGIVRLQASSSVTAALALLNLPPRPLLDEAKLPVTLAEGTVDLSGTIAFPVQKKPPPGSVQFDLVGAIHDVNSDVLVPGHVLRAKHLDLTVANDDITISGQGRLNDTPFQATWWQPLEQGETLPSQISGTIALSAQSLTQFGIPVPPGLLEGQAQARITLDLPRDGSPRLALSSDLTGLAMRYPALRWDKGAQSPGNLAVMATLGDQISVEALDLQADGLDLSGRVDLLDGNRLGDLVLSRLAVGRWLDVQARVTGQGDDTPPAIAVTGGQIDLRALGAEADAGASAGQQIALELDRLQVSDGVFISPFRADLAVGGGLDGRFGGRLNGAAQITGRVVPQDGRSAIRMQSEDAGGVLSAAGILNKANGGSFDLALVPQGGPGDYRGQLTIRDISLLDAPIIAALLNAVSIVGLLDELGGKGIHFSTVSADFNISDDKVDVFKASAVGPSIGLSLDGVFDLGTAQLAMQGVLSPVYLINGIGSVLTREGEGLIGFNYELTGSAKAPVVTVNPLSALAPGILRQIFRKPSLSTDP